MENNNAANQQANIFVENLPKEPPKFTEKSKLPPKWYYRPDEAAEFLDCTGNDLIHFGAIGTLEFIMPISLARVALITALDETNNLEYIDGDVSMDGEFDGISNNLHFVTIPKEMLAFIEELGATNPIAFDIGSTVGTMDSFYTKGYVRSENYLKKVSPSDIVRTLTELKSNSLFLLADEINWIVDDEGRLVVTSFVPFRRRIRKEEIFIPAHAIDGLLKGQKIPNDGHALFTYADNAKRRISTKSRENHHEIKREEIFKAAIYCKSNFSDECKTARDWAKCIDEKAPLFWREAGRPPLELETIEKHLRAALKTTE